MKKFLCLPVVFLFASFFSLVAAFGQCDGDVVLETQAEVDAFAQNYGCSVIQGNLRVGSLWSTNLTDITNLDGLSNITTIDGTFLIRNNHNLTSLSGLENLSSVGELEISSNDNLTSFLGLENLSSVGELEVSSNDNLTSFLGLENLSSIGDLRILNNNKLTSFLGLENLLSIEGFLKIESNDYLISLSGLENLSSVGELVEILSNDLLININLENVLSVGELLILENPQLENIYMSSLTNIGGDFELINNYELKQLTGLTSLSLIERNFIIGESSFGFLNPKPGLINFVGLENLTEIVGDFVILNDESLISFEGLENLTEIGGEFVVSNNESLVSFKGLESLTNIGEDFDINRNTSLTTLEDFEDLSYVGRLVSFTNNSQLADLSGLENLSVLSHLAISENENLSSLKGLENLTSISGDNLSFIDGNVFIRNNPSLHSLVNLSNLSSVDGNLTIEGNELLMDCCILLDILSGVSGELVLDGNGFSCSSEEAIIISCSGVEIQSQAFHDINENGIFDETEQFLIQDFNLEPDAALAFGDNMGITHFYLTEFGIYTIDYEPFSPLWSYDESVSDIEIQFFDTTFQDTLLYFPMIPIADFIIQDIDLTSSITRCNQETNYWLTYTNEGTTINDGYIELIPDNIATFVSADPPADSTANGKLYWFYENLYPTYSNQIHLIYEMPSVEELGQAIDFEAQIQTNEGFADHKAILSSELICAYDPNDKLVTPSGYYTDNYTLFGDTLEYTVRFQNTGNDTAFTVIIRDELSEYLDLNTFRPIASSHNVETQVDIESRLATFTFNDIYLPDSFVNEPGSHGFVKYQVLGTESLSENTDVKNTASIFFDANPPIVTNTVSNRMVSVLPTLPILTASEEALDFGEFAWDESVYVPQMLTIQNPGDLDLIVENFAFGDAAFYVQVNSLTVAGQGSIEVPVYFAPSEAGTYQTELTLESNVGSVSIALSGTAIEATGVNSVLPAQFVLFPNPTEGLFYLESKGAQIQSYHIYNSLGKLILEEKTSEVVERIDLSKQAKGLYFISVETDEGVSVEKILIQ